MSLYHYDGGTMTPNPEWPKDGPQPRSQEENAA